MTITCILTDDQPLTLLELANACQVEPAWIAERIMAGLVITPIPARLDGALFGSRAIERTRQLLRIENDFDANPELAALVVDMMEQLTMLRRQIRQDHPVIDIL